MTKILLSLVFLFLAAYSQSPSSKHSSMLWKISGNHLLSPSYIFGTYHTRDPEINNLSPQVYDALKSTQGLYTEIPMSEKSENQVVLFTKLSKPIPLKQRLHPKTLKLLRNYLKEYSPQFNIHILSKYKTWAIALMITNQEDTSKYPHMPFMDEHITKIAKEVHIKHMGLETPLEQLHYFDTLNKTEQELFLIDMLHSTKESSYQESLKQWYQKGEAIGFVALQEKFKASDIKQQKLDKKLLTTLLFERNKRFLHRIHTILQNNPKHSYFFAIGAGHLSDKKGLISTLKELGYQVKKLN